MNENSNQVNNIDNSNQTNNENQDTIKKKQLLNDNQIDKIINFSESILEPINHSDEFTLEEKEAYKNKAILCYIPFISAILYLMKEHAVSDYMKFHINQGLIVTCTFSVLEITSIIVNVILSFIWAWLAAWVNSVFFMAIIVILVISFVGLINTFNGKSKELILIGKYKLIK